MSYLSKLLLILSIVVSSSFAKEDLLFYIGITMVKPVSELAKEFEKKENCHIKILQGGSQDLYDSIKASKIGDLYLPGSVLYRNKNIKDGLLLDGKFVGYNKLSLVVKKGNPKGIKPLLEELSNETYNVILGSDQSSSVGKASKKTLEKFKLYKRTVLNTLFFESDSRNIINAIKENKADLALNWYATTFWSDNKKYVDALVLEDKYAKKSKLVLNLLNTSKNKKLTKKFMEFAASKDGQKVFEKYGFLDKKDIQNFKKITF